MQLSCRHGRSDPRSSSAATPRPAPPRVDVVPTPPGARAARPAAPWHRPVTGYSTPPALLAITLPPTRARTRSTRRGCCSRRECGPIRAATPYGAARPLPTHGAGVTYTLTELPLPSRRQYDVVGARLHTPEQRSRTTSPPRRCAPLVTHAAIARATGRTPTCKATFAARRAGRGDQRPRVPGISGAQPASVPLRRRTRAPARQTARRAGALHSG